MHFLLRALGSICCVFHVSGASAYCSEPYFSENPPDTPSSYHKPDVPYCLNEYGFTGKHSCESYEIDMYFDEVNDYIQKLNDYTSEAIDFANDAARYANEVTDYARCEAENVKNQHE